MSYGMWGGVILNFALLIEFRDKISADAHLVQALFHLTRLFIAHCCAQLVIRHKAVIRAAETVKHVPVLRRETAYVHAQRDKCADEEAYHKIGLAQQHDYRRNDNGHESAESNGHRSVALRVG